MTYIVRGYAKDDLDCWEDMQEFSDKEDAEDYIRLCENDERCDFTNFEINISDEDE